jgi:hypothetical protein
MYLVPDRLTLDSLLSDPLTQLVMRSDNLTPADVARAFHEAKAGLAARHADSFARFSVPGWTGMEHGTGWSGT